MKSFTSNNIFLLLLVFASTCHLGMSVSPKEELAIINNKTEDISISGACKINITGCTILAGASPKDIENYLKRLPQTTKSGQCFVACMLKRKNVLVNDRFNVRNMIETTRAVFGDESKFMIKFKRAIAECINLVEGMRDVCEYASVFNDCMSIKLDRITDTVRMILRMKTYGVIDTYTYKWSAEDDHILNLDREEL